jgi:hypothetical protein
MASLPIPAATQRFALANTCMTDSIAPFWCDIEVTHEAAIT